MQEASITIPPQEEMSGIRSHYFSGNVVVTSNFARIFGEDGENNMFWVILETLTKIHKMVLTETVDYFQVGIYEHSYDSSVKSMKFWIIDDESVVTFLMPEDY